MKKEWYKDANELEKFHKTYVSFKNKKKALEKEADIKLEEEWQEDEEYQSAQKYYIQKTNGIFSEIITGLINFDTAMAALKILKDSCPNNEYNLVNINDDYNEVKYKEKDLNDYNYLILKDEQPIKKNLNKADADALFFFYSKINPKSKIEIFYNKNSY